MNTENIQNISDVQVVKTESDVYRLNFNFVYTTQTDIRASIQLHSYVYFSDNDDDSSLSVYPQKRISEHDVVYCTISPITDYELRQLLSTDKNVPNVIKAYLLSRRSTICHEAFSMLFNHCENSDYYVWDESKVTKD